MSDKESPKLWEKYPHIWKTESSFLSWVRGGIRRGMWNKSPVKLEFINLNRRRIKNPNERSAKRFPEVWGGTCELCKGEFLTSQLDVDHVEGNHSLKKLEDIQTFVEAIVLVTLEDLQLLCKDCHNDKSYADKHGVSLQEAKATRQAIAILKTKRDKEWLADRGLTPESNQAKRRVQIIEYLLKERLWVC